jgi:glycosyltransferase involved in cell wall biosynthesis
MKLSIITINYNNKNGLKETIESVISQTNKDFEWVIIDGGSTDGSKELIEQNSNYISYFVSEPDSGIYQAMNKGIVTSHGNYLLFLNSGDTLIDKDTIERALPLLINRDIYVGKIVSKGKMNESYEEQSDFSSEGILKKLTFTWIPHQASFFRRGVFEEYGRYREDMKIVSDWWFYFWSLVLGKASIASLPLTIASYDANGISHTNRAQAIEEQEKLLNEHPAISTYYHFYKNNKEIVEALKGNKCIFLLFRLYYYLYRKIHRRDT